MQIRKEQLILLATLALLGLLAWRSLGQEPARRGGGGAAKTPAFVEHLAPDPARVLPAPRATPSDAARELFAPPSDTHPLPPLEFQQPPLAALPGLRPPPLPGPAPALYSRLLRGSVAPLDAPDLFAAEGAAAPAVAGAAPAPAAANLPLAERIASFKRVYDWVRTNDFKFGQIVNADRFGLPRRPNEAILFIEYNPEKGVPILAGNEPAPIARNIVNEFNFAETVPNQIELQRAQFGNPLAAAEYDAALSFAGWCVEKRYEAPRALAVAEELYRRAAGVITTDPAPRLGLARCFEAGFEFEKAFQEYKALLESTNNNPLVLARLAELEARFRLFDAARARLEEAARGARTTWQVQLALGSFLAQRGEYAAAIEHLRLANQFEPTASEWKREKVRLRVELASALIGAGELAEAGEWVDKALQADPADGTALAARLALLTLGSGKPLLDDVGGSGGGFELLLARGMEKLGHRDAASARAAEDLLEQAVVLDPLRASVALRALSWLAESTGHPEQALHLVDSALENDPQDAWALYQRGRLCVVKDDLDGAEDAFGRALSIELDFEDALVAMGELQHRRGECPAADRYLERALQLDPKRADVLALRGLNQIQMGALRDAEDSFKAARAIEPEQGIARAGQAWCYYRANDATQAITALRDLDDSRRTLPPTDPLRVWALAQIERIQDHVQKVAWTDHFERSSLMNGWEVDERTGPVVSIHDGIVTLAGVIKTKGASNNRARLWQERSASSFVSVEMKITVHADTTAMVGLSVSREQQRAGESSIEAEAVVARHAGSENKVSTRLMSRGHEDDPYTDVVGLEWRFEQPMTVRIERTGDSSDTKIRILVDGFPVVDNKPMPTLGRGTNALRLSLIAEGDIGKKVSVDLDDVEVVYRASK